MAKRDYYEVLGVGRDTGKDEIKRAYRKIAVENHPDRQPDNKAAEERFKEATEAYGILSDDAKRRNYNQFGFAGVQGGDSGMHTDFSNVFREFEDIFGDYNSIFDLFSGGRRKRSTSNRSYGEDIELQLNVPFETAVFGGETTIEFQQKTGCAHCKGTGSEPGYGHKTCVTCGGSGQLRQSSGFFSIASVCPICNGTGAIVIRKCSVCRGERTLNETKRVKITIPAGINSRQILTLSRQGNKGAVEQAAGDLQLIINVLPHKYFFRREYDLYCVVPISITQAVLGGSIFVVSLDNKKLRIKIPQGTQNEKTFRIRSEGVPLMNTRAGRRGDLYITVRVEIPTKLSSEVQQLWNRLADMLRDSDQITPIAIADLER